MNISGISLYCASNAWLNAARNIAVELRPRESGGGGALKIKKRVTDAVIAANRWNSQKSTGAKTEWGKKVVSQNAGKHWVYAKNLVFKNEQELMAFNSLLRKLRQLIGGDDPVSQMVSFVLAVEYLRYARSLKLDQRIYKGQSPGPGRGKYQ